MTRTVTQPNPRPTCPAALQDAGRAEVTHRRPRAMRARGFTIVEVVVSIGVVLILLYVIALLFTGVSTASDLILSNYQVSNYTTALGAQLRDDIRKMNRQGYLVIRNQTILDPATNRWTDLDQISFLTTGPATSSMYQLRWVGPTGVVSDTGLKRSFTTNESRVWYGHVHNTTTPVYSVTDSVGPFATTDSRNWSLGRQQLLLSGQYVATEASPSTNAPADNIWFNYTVATSVPTTNFFAGATRDMLPFVTGLTDMVADPITASPAAIRAAAIYGDIDPTTSAVDAPNIDNTKYPWTPPFLPAASSFAGLDVYQRLEAACFRVYGRKKPSDVVNNIKDTLMETQTIIAPFCSSFRVEFAGDYVNNGTPITAVATGSPDGYLDINKTGPNSANGDPVSEAFPQQLFWYGGFDRVANSRRIVEPTGIYGNPPTTRGLNARNASYAASGSIPASNLYTAVFGYDHDQTPWPRLLRITINLQDDKGRLRDSYLKSLNTGDTTTDGRQYQFILEVPQ